MGVWYKLSMRRRDSLMMYVICYSLVNKARCSDCAGMEQREQEKVLARHHPNIRDSLQVQPIFAHLNQMGLLTENEREFLLSPVHTRLYKVDSLIQWLPQKGRDSLHRFIVCLKRSSVDARGHKELARQLERGSRTRISAYRTDNKSSILFTLTTICTILLLFSLWLYMPYLWNHLSWWTESHLLPDATSLLLGREKEVSELTVLLDPQNNDVRIVSIVGPTGIGKSTVAVEVGHQLSERGTIINYVNVGLVPLKYVSNKLLQNAGIVEAGNSSQDRLLQWLRRELKGPLVIILDNCDLALATDKAEFYHFLETLLSATLKVMITSRREVKLKSHAEDFIEYLIGEIHPDASCQILQTVSNREMSKTTCDSITMLVGNSPYSLVLIGTILESTSIDVSTLISRIEKEMETVCSISVERRLNASISISLKHLSSKLINLGMYLSQFPTTFSREDVCSVLSSLVGEDCALVDQLGRRSLLIVCNNDRYHFRDIIRNHFRRMWRRSTLMENENDFWRRYFSHYSSLLHIWSEEFKKNPRNVLELLELEKQDIRHFVTYTMNYCGELPNLYMEVLQTLRMSVETGFVLSLYTEGDLIDLLQSILSCIEVIGDSNTQGGADTVYLYVYFTMQLMDHKSAEVEFVINRTQHWLDQHMSIDNLSSVEIFYLKLSSYYHNLGNHQGEVYCHVKRLKALGKLDNCVSSTCSYIEISEAYYTMGSYELSFYFQELHIEHSSLSTLQLTEALLRLHTCMLKAGNRTKADRAVGKILEISTTLMDAEASEILDNLELHINVTNVLYFHNLDAEANLVQTKLITAVKEVSSSHHNVGKVREAMFSLIHSLSEARQYASVPEVVQIALDTYQGEETNEVATLYLVLGKAELYNHRRRASLNSLKMVLKLYYNNPAFFHYARDACKAILIQTHIEIACFYIALEETVILARSIYEFIKSDTFDIKQFSSSYIYEFPDAVPNGLLADQIEDAPVVSFYIVFFVKWCLANFRYLFSCQFIFQILNFVVVVVKLSVVVSVLVCPYLILYYCVNLTKYLYRTLWNPVWTDEY